MATDLPLKFHECGNPAVLSALDPFVEILFCRVIGRELEDETKLLLQIMGTTESAYLATLSEDAREKFVFDDADVQVR